jgi:hypothetical protein
MNSWMRPLKSCICTKLTLPCTRLSTMRPATFTRRASRLDHFGRLVVLVGKLGLQIARESCRS